MVDIWMRLKTETKPILLYGSGDGAEKIYAELMKNGINISGVFASDGFRRKRSFKNFNIVPFEEAKRIYGDFVGLFAFGSNTEEVILGVKEMMKSREILVAEMPVFGDSPFNLEFAIKNADKLKEVYNVLADEQSKRVFEQTVLFKLDGDINRLFSCETSEDEAFNSILKLKKGDSFLDLGAYNGDTVLDFVKRVGEYSHITAVEPDKKSFAKLLKNTEHLYIDCINTAISYKCGEIPFCFKGSRGSVFGGEDSVKAITVDSLERNFDYIKFDVEGQEINAIMGAENLISEHKPKMLISCYHKIDDYFEIPLAVLRIRPDYKVYMRHYPYIPAWDTNFYFI